MKNLILKGIILSMVLIVSSFSEAQVTNQEFDTILIYKPQKHGYEYFINNHPLFSTVTIVRAGIHIHDFPKDRPVNSYDQNYELGSYDGIFQLETVKPKSFLLKGEINFKDEISNWNIYTHLEGVKKVVRTEDESENDGFSWSKEKTFIIFWDRIPLCMISEADDTIGTFDVV